jgi:eukaryotic-like serine/threonine-protein kinase
MKRCPECRRDYVDDTLLYCLEDGVALVQGSVASSDEPPTAILRDASGHGEAATRPQIFPTDQTAILPSGINSKSFDKRLLLAPLAFALIVLAGFFIYRYATQPKQIESIAVMPFVNESGNADVEYLSDGMTEALIRNLSHLPNLNVKARTSVFRYKGKEIDLQQIAQELNVQAILTGRVVQRGDDLTVSIELADTRTENTIWNEKYDRKIAEVFALQEEIAGEISSTLHLKLTGVEKEQLTKRPTENLRAFQYYMQGRSYAHRRTREDLLAAISHYDKAISEDRNYALAHAGLAEAYAQLGLRGYLLAEEGRRKALDAARTALALDENLAEAHVANGLVYIVLPTHDLPLGDREMRRAIELSPSLATAHFYLGVSLVRQGRLAEALEKNLRARELDPLSPIIARQTTIHYFFERDHVRALEHLRQAYELGPPFNVSWEVGVYIQNGLFDEALAELEKAKRDRKDDPILIYSTGAVYAARGERAKTLQVVKALQDMSGASLSQAHVIAKLYAGLNDKEMTFSWLERGLAAGAIGAFYQGEPVWDPVRDDARFTALLRQMGILK